MDTLFLDSTKDNFYLACFNPARGPVPPASFQNKLRVFRLTKMNETMVLDSDWDNNNILLIDPNLPAGGPGFRKLVVNGFPVNNIGPLAQDLCRYKLRANWLGYVFNEQPQVGGLGKVNQYRRMNDMLNWSAYGVTVDPMTAVKPAKRWDRVDIINGSPILFSFTDKEDLIKCQDDKRDLEAKNKGLETDKTNLTTDLQNCKTDKQMLEAKNKGLETDKKKLTTDLQTCKTDKQTLEMKNKGLETDKKKLTTDLQNCKTDKQTLEMKNKGLETDKTNLNTQLQTCKTDKQALEMKNRSLETDKTNLNTQLQNCKADKQNLETRNRGLETDKTNLTNQLQSCRTSKQNSENLIQQLQNEKQNLNSRINNLSNQVSSLNNRNTVLSNQVTTLYNEAVRLRRIVRGDRC